MNRAELSSLIKSNRPDDIKEWVNYHLALGFDKITIFDNESTFSIKELFTQNCKVEVQEVQGDYGYSGEGIINQRRLYTKLYNEKHGQVDWLATIDDDEFIYTDKRSIKDVLDDNLIVICMVWKMISSSTILETRKSTLIDSFYYTSTYTPWNNRVFVKSLVNLNKCDTIEWHTPHLPTCNNKREGRTLNGLVITNDFLPMVSHDFYDSQSIILYHYYHQSYEDRLWKAARGGLKAAIQMGRTTDKDSFISEIAGKYTYQDLNMINKKKELGL